MKLAITGGGSGGHTIPAMTVYDAFVEHYDAKRQQHNKDNHSFDCIYIGSHLGIEKEVAQKKEISYYPITTGKLRRYFSVTNFTDLFRIIKGMFEALTILKRFKPNALFSTGGFVSVPVVIASRLLKIPVVIHEQTSSIGLANKIAGYFAQKIAITFPSSKEFFPVQKVVHTGQPIRKELFLGNGDNCYEQFELNKSLPIIYITGGSQGSHKINMTVQEILPDLLKKCHVIHQCGKSQANHDYEDLKKFRSTLADDIKDRYIIKDFIQEELKDILNAASILIGRSGAGTVTEAMALRIPSIFIPLAIATRNEQYQNAKMMESIGGAEIIEEAALSPELLKNNILSILSDSEKRDKMIHSLSQLAKPDATNELVKIILNLC